MLGYVIIVRLVFLEINFNFGNWNSNVFSTRLDSTRPPTFSRLEPPFHLDTPTQLRVTNMNCDT